MELFGAVLQGKKSYAEVSITSVLMQIMRNELLNLLLSANIMYLLCHVIQKCQSRMPLPFLAIWRSIYTCELLLHSTNFWTFQVLLYLLRSRKYTVIHLEVFRRLSTATALYFGFSVNKCAAWFFPLRLHWLVSSIGGSPAYWHI